MENKGFALQDSGYLMSLGIRRRHRDHSAPFSSPSPFPFLPLLPPFLSSPPITPLLYHTPYIPHYPFSLTPPHTPQRYINLSALTKLKKIIYNNNLIQLRIRLRVEIFKKFLQKKANSNCVKNIFSNAGENDMVIQDFNLLTGRANTNIPARQDMLVCIAEEYRRAFKDVYGRTTTKGPVGKERGLSGKLLQIAKRSKWWIPGKPVPEQMYGFFSFSLENASGWMRKNMSLSIILSNVTQLSDSYNEYKEHNERIRRQQADDEQTGWAYFIGQKDAGEADVHNV